MTVLVDLMCCGGVIIHPLFLNEYLLFNNAILYNTLLLLYMHISHMVMDEWMDC